MKKIHIEQSEQTENNASSLAAKPIKLARETVKRLPVKSGVKTGRFEDSRGWECV